VYYVNNIKIQLQLVCFGIEKTEGMEKSPTHILCIDIKNDGITFRRDWG